MDEARARYIKLYGSEEDGWKDFFVKHRSDIVTPLFKGVTLRGMTEAEFVSFLKIYSRGAPLDSKKVAALWTSFKRSRDIYTLREGLRELLKPTNIFERETFSSFNGLNEFIERNYHAYYAAEDLATATTGTLATGFAKECGKKSGKPEFCGWERKDSLGYDNDCLIHSLLNAACPAFRRLYNSASLDGEVIDGLHYKREIARAFRYFLYPAIPTVAAKISATGKTGATKSAAKEFRARIFGDTFLLDEDLQILCDSFDVNALVFESDRSGYTFNSGELVEATLEPRAVYVGNSEGGSVYMIYNDHNVHFEAVKRPEGYTIPYSSAKKIVDSYMTTTAVDCPYEQGDIVMVSRAEGAPVRMFVLYRKITDMACSELYLTSEDTYREYLADKSKSKDDTAELEKRTQMKVSRENFGRLQLVSEGGKRKRRTRKSRSKRRVATYRRSHKIL